MGLITSIIGLGLAMGAITSTAEALDKKHCPNLNYTEFDAENARFGIRGQIGFTEDRIMKIATRCGVKPNKVGILPENGWSRCKTYVERYSNEARDFSDFKKAWERTIQTQINNKQKRAKRTTNSQYELEKDYVEHNLNKNGTPIVLEYKHWHGMPKEEHLKRMNDLMENTFWGTLCKEPPILRDNPRMENSYVETWIMYPLPNQKQGKWSTMRSFKNKYKSCCEELGYEHGL